MKTKEKNQLTKLQRRLKVLFLILATIGLIIPIFSLSENNVLTIISFTSTLFFGFLGLGFEHFLSLEKYRKTFIKFTIFLITLTIVSLFGYLQIFKGKEEGIQTIYSLLYLVIIILLTAYFAGTLSNYVDKKEWEESFEKRKYALEQLRILIFVYKINYWPIPFYVYVGALSFLEKKGYVNVTNLPDNSILVALKKEECEKIKSLSFFNEFRYANFEEKEVVEKYSKLLLK